MNFLVMELDKLYTLGPSPFFDFKVANENRPLWLLICRCISSLTDELIVNCQQGSHLNATERAPLGPNFVSA